MRTTIRRFNWCLALAFAALFAGSLPAMSQELPLSVEGYAIQSEVKANSYKDAVSIGTPYVALADGPVLEILDVTAPASPVEISKVSMPMSIRSMCSQGTFVYVAAGKAGLMIVDVSNPSSPYVAGRFSSALALSFAVDGSGQFGYLVDGSSKIYVLNLKDLNHIKIVRIKSVGKSLFSQVAVMNDALVAAAGPEGVYVFNIQKPRHPKKMKQIKDLQATVHFTFQGRLMAAADTEAGLVFIDFTKWTDPQEMGRLTFQTPVLGCSFLGNDLPVVVTAEGGGGYSLVDAQDPADPSVITHAAAPEPVYGVSLLSGNEAYLLCGDAGLWTLDASDTAAPQAAQVMAGNPAIGALVAQGNIVYAASDSIIQSWDYTDPAHPVLLGSVPTPMPASELLIQGHTLFASCTSAGVVIYDVSNPSSPVQLSDFAVDNPALQISVSQSLLAIGEADTGVVLADISDPANPVKAGEYAITAGYISGVAFASPTTLWVCQQNSGLYALDVSDPANPAILTSSILGGISTGRIVVSGNYIYQAAGYSGLKVADISNIDSPSLVTAFATQIKGGLDLILAGDKLLVSAGDYGLREYDLTTPDKPAGVTYFQAPGYCYSAALLSNGATVVAAREGGLWCLSPSTCPGDSLLLPCDGAVLSPSSYPLFSWMPQSGHNFKVEFSTDPGFKKNKIIRALVNNSKFDVPYLVPADNTWRRILKKSRGGLTVYWRVVYRADNKNSFSESRSFTLY